MLANESFGSARAVFGLLQVFGWVTVAMAVLGAMFLGGKGYVDTVALIVQTVAIGVSGLLLVALAAIGRAQIVAAELLGELVRSGQRNDASALVSPRQEPAGTAHSTAKATFAHHLGVEIEKNAFGFYVGGKRFETLDMAKRHINSKQS